MRVMGGLAGAIIVRPSGKENLPSSITDAEEYVLVLHKMNVGQAKDNNGYVTQGCSNGATCDPTTQPPGCTTANKASSTTFSPFRQYSYRELSAATGSELDATVTLTNLGTSVTKGSWTYWSNELQTTFTNGQFEPTVTTTINEVHTFRIVHAAGGEELKIQLTGGGCTMQVIALDGIYLKEARTYTTSDTIFLMAGSRVEVQLRCTSNGPGCALKAANQYSSQNVITLVPSGTGQTKALTTTAELAAITRPYYLSDLTGETVDVYYASHVSQGSRPTSTCGGSLALGGGQCFVFYVENPF
jgi:FtsP/CotA-like multicopper oxidase with cupredoxin domain